MANTYAQAHTTMHNNNRKCGEDTFTNGVTNGAQWYDVSGKAYSLSKMHEFS